MTSVLHGRTAEYPFFTLLRHGHAHVAGPMAGGDASASRTRDSGGGPGATRAAASTDPGVLPYVLVRLPYSADPRSEYGAPDSPSFLKAWHHELGHALHVLASAHRCRPGLCAADLLLTPSSAGLAAGAFGPRTLPERRKEHQQVQDQ